MGCNITDMQRVMYLASTIELYVSTRDACVGGHLIIQITLSQNKKINCVWNPHVLYTGL